MFIELDLKKPITRGETSNVMGNKHWIPLIFEKLFCICFGCERIICGKELCDRNKNSSKTLSNQYGLWLREATRGKTGRRRNSFSFQASSFNDNVNQGGKEEEVTTQMQKTMKRNVFGMEERVDHSKTQKKQGT